MDRFKKQKKIVMPNSDIEKFHLAIELLTKQTLHNNPTLSVESAQMASFITVSEVMERTIQQKTQTMIRLKMITAVHLN